MSSSKRLLPGGSAGNEHLTAVLATLLLVLLTVEGATLLDLESLLTVHAFVGMLIIPVAALKLSSTAWRTLRYYLRGEEYVRRGPPHIVLRALVAPITVVATTMLLATGVALLSVGEVRGTLVDLHKASFAVWLGAIGVHVLAHLRSLLRALRRRVPGLVPRLALVAAGVTGGLVLATATLPSADALQDRASASVGLDAG
jgi:hypothetical protein